MDLGLKVHVDHVLGLKHDLGLGVDPSYKPCWDHITSTQNKKKVKMKQNTCKEYVGSCLYIS